MKLLQRKQTQVYFWVEAQQSNGHEGSLRVRLAAHLEEGLRTKTFFCSNSRGPAAPSDLSRTRLQTRRRRIAARAIGWVRWCNLSTQAGRAAADTAETDWCSRSAALHHVAADTGNVRPEGQRRGCLRTPGAGPSHYWELIGVFLGVRLVICGAFTRKDPPPPSSLSPGIVFNSMSPLDMTSFLSFPL